MHEDLWEHRLGSVIFERYRLQSFLARGGMGAVFLCQDLRLSGQQWAIKEMLTANPTEVALVEESFRREAEILSTLQHPSLPAVVDSFVEDQRHYVVMEFVRGETLAARVARTGPVTAEQALEWGVQLAEVLGYLHSQKPPVIFRDLKPENVMVNDQNLLKLVDFGLARHFRPGQHRDTQAAGSVGYSAPEQWEDSNQSDERTDIYGLGATLYFALCGRPPTPLYGQQSLREHRPDLDGALESLLLKCLEPKAERRFADCATLRDQIQSLRTGGPRLRASQHSRSRGRGPLLLLLACIGLLGAGVHFFHASPHARLTELESMLRATAPSKAQARLHLKAGDVAQAQSELDRLVERYPADGEAQILRANAKAMSDSRPLLHIPVFSSVTGPEYEGIQMLDGLALAQVELNHRGGVRDALHPEDPPKLVWLEFLDCQSRQDLTLEFYLQSSQNQEYQAAIGPWSSQQLMAISPIVESAGFPTIAPTASDPRLASLGDNSLSVADSDDGRVEAIARRMFEQGARRAIVIGNDESVISHSAGRCFEKTFASLGGQTVARSRYLEDTRDFGPVIDRLRGVSADAIFIPDYRSDAVVGLARQLRARGWNQRLGALAAVYSHSPLKNGGQELNGMLLSTYFYPQAPEPSVRDFVRRYQALTGESSPSHREVNSYDSLYLMAQAIEKVGWDRTRLREYFDSLGKARPAYKGVSGEFALARRLRLRKAYLLEIRDGRLGLLPGS